MSKRSPFFHRLFAWYARSANHPAKLRMLKWIRRFLGFKILIVEVPGGLMRLDSSDFLQNQILMGGVYEPKTLNLMQRLLKMGDCFVDVGANVGQYSLAATVCVGETGRVIAVEPNPAICTELLVNRRLSQAERGIRIVCAALSNRSGLLNFTMPPPTNRGASREATTQQLDQTDWYVVPCVTLAAVLEHFSVERIRVVKIDVEGSELRVLQGLLNADHPCRPEHILFEFLPRYFSYGEHPQDLLNYLRTHKYEILNVDGVPYSYEDEIPEDNLWARRETT